jgi:hypothetical protein
VVRLIYLEGGTEQARANKPGMAAGWSPGPLAPALVVLLYGLLANPVYGLAVQGAAALRLP